MKNIILSLILLSSLSCSQKTHLEPVLEAMNASDSLFLATILSDTIDSKVAIRADSITRLLNHFPPQHEGHFEALKTVAKLISYKGLIQTDSILQYLNTLEEYCSYYDFTRDFFIVSPILEWVNKGTETPIVIIDCPLNGKLGQSRMRENGFVLLNRHEIMKTYHFLIKNISKKYHISKERWFNAIKKQELYHATTPNGGTEFESDIKSIHIAGYMYLAFRIMDISYYFFEDKAIIDNQANNKGYVHSHGIYYECCTQFVKPRLGNQKDLQSYWGNIKCESHDPFDVEMCILDESRTWSMSVYQRLIKEEPLLLEKVYSCLDRSHLQK